ncbi:MAG TPA: STAS/SEC14 domain-containing protein [Geobacteraceae bacterium]
MGATIQRDENGIWVVRVFGALRKEEMDAVQEVGIKELDPHPDEDAKVLVMVEENFLGWVGDEVWNDMTFFVQYGDRIAKIAIVGDPKWETRMLMFTGAGFRSAQVKYFAESHLAEAYEWLG